MISKTTNKNKIVNDPVFGLINIKSEIIFDLIEHPYFQRLRRIKQLGLSCLVYPGANHTRFEHAIGAFNLMNNAINTLISKGVHITQKEAEAANIAILLHDIGHGPFSHALEHTLIPNFTHEDISLLLMEKLNDEFNGKLGLAICIFKNEYEKEFLNQLVSSQLDVDRLDYLRRDSFYSGVAEGTIGSDRIIQMMNVVDGKLVVDKKGIYSVEKFLVARRLMYWQVYLHKTVIAAEYMLIKLLERAQQLSSSGIDLFGSSQLQWLLKNKIDTDEIRNSSFIDILLKNFVLLDDSDILSSMKTWALHPDRILSYLANGIINRKLLRIKIAEKTISDIEIAEKTKQARQLFSMTDNDIKSLVFTGEISNNAYESDFNNIMILSKNGKTADINKASDIELRVLSKTVRKHFLCYPKELDIS